MVRTEEGFTLLELLVAMVVFAVLLTLGVFALRDYRNALAEKGETQDVVNTLRSAQALAVAQDTTYCVDFGTGTSTTQYSVYRTPGLGQGTLPAGSPCTAGTRTDGPLQTQQGVTLTGAAFLQRDGTTTSYVLFYPRGAASGGSVGVSRKGSSTTYSVAVDGLTGRVACTQGCS